MNDDNLAYSSDLDNIVIKTVEDILSTKVISSNRILSGEFNYVYKVATDKGEYILRIFREKDFPELDKLIWINKKLEENTIPTASILYSTRDSKYFKNGFMIQEFINGDQGLDAIYNKKLTFVEFHTILVKELNKIHAIPVSKFGKIKNGEGEFDNYVEYKKNEILEKSKVLKDFDQSITDSVIGKIEKELSKYSDKFNPTIIHGDATADNSIIDKNGNLVLIDWDHAVSESWFFDYAWLTYCGSHASKNGSLEERRILLRELFLKYHDLQGYTLEEIDKIEILSHIILAYRLLAYYSNSQGNIGAYEFTLNKLINLLNN